MPNAWSTIFFSRPEGSLVHSLSCSRSGSSRLCKADVRF